MKILPILSGCFFLFTGFVSAPEAKTAEEWYAQAFEQSLQEKNEAAVQSYLRAIQIKPGWAEAHHGLAVLYSRMKDGVRAIHHLRKAEKLYQKIPNLQAQRNLAIVRNNLKKAYARFDLDPKEFQKMELLRPPSGKKDWRISGVGFFIGDQGYLLTLHHVVEGHDDLRVRFVDNETVPAQKVRRFIIYNLVVLKLEDTRKVPKKALRIGDSSGMGVGDKVFAADYGNLMHEKRNGLPTLEGEITALKAIQNDKNFFQMKLLLNPEHSGGPLLNSAGEIAGIILSKKRTMEMFKSDGRVPEGQVALKSSYLKRILSSIPGLVLSATSNNPAEPKENFSELDGSLEMKRNFVFIETHP